MTCIYSRVCNLVLIYFPADAQDIKKAKSEATASPSPNPVLAPPVNPPNPYAGRARTSPPSTISASVQRPATVSWREFKAADAALTSPRPPRSNPPIPRAKPLATGQSRREAPIPYNEPPATVLPTGPRASWGSSLGASALPARDHPDEVLPVSTAKTIAPSLASYGAYRGRGGRATPDARGRGGGRGGRGGRGRRGRGIGAKSQGGVKTDGEFEPLELLELGEVDRELEQIGFEGYASAYSRNVWPEYNLTGPDKPELAFAHRRPTNLQNSRLPGLLQSVEHSTGAAPANVRKWAREKFGGEYKRLMPYDKGDYARVPEILDPLHHASLFVARNPDIAGRVLHTVEVMMMDHESREFDNRGRASQGLKEIE